MWREKGETRERSNDEKGRKEKRQTNFEWLAFENHFINR
jgi:hypothetical protein